MRKKFGGDVQRRFAQQIPPFLPDKDARIQKPAGGTTTGGAAAVAPKDGERPSNRIASEIDKNGRDAVQRQADGSKKVGGLVKGGPQKAVYKVRECQSGHDQSSRSGQESGSEEELVERAELVIENSNADRSHHEHPYPPEQLPNIKSQHTQTTTSPEKCG